MAENTGWGTIARTGDTGSPVTPAWSHDGKTIIYTSVSGSTDTGVRVLSGLGKLYSVPYGDRKGGAATALPGGGDPAFHAYYPAFSPDDHFVAFTRAPSIGISYDIPEAESSCCRAKAPRCRPAWWPTIRRPAPTAQPRRHQQLAQVGARGQRVRRHAVLLADVLVAAVAQPPAADLHHARDRRQDRRGDVVPGAGRVESTRTESNHTPAWDTFEIVVQ